MFRTCFIARVLRFVKGWGQQILSGLAYDETKHGLLSKYRGRETSFVAVRMSLANSSRPPHEISVYPCDKDSLDNIVLEHLVTDGHTYQMQVGGRAVEDADLKMHAKTQTTLEVVVLVVQFPGELSFRETTPMVVLKSIGDGSIRRHVLTSFPPNVDALDDMVWEHLVIDRKVSFCMKVAGEDLTDEVLHRYQQKKHCMIVHIFGCSDGAVGSPPQLFPSGLSSSCLAIRGEKMKELRASMEEICTLLRTDITNGAHHASNALKQAVALGNIEIPLFAELEDLNDFPEAREAVSILANRVKVEFQALWSARSALRGLMNIVLSLACNLFNNNVGEAYRQMNHMGREGIKMEENLEASNQQLDEDSKEWTWFQQHCREEVEEFVRTVREIRRQHCSLWQGVMTGMHVVADAMGDMKGSDLIGNAAVLESLRTLAMTFQALHSSIDEFLVFIHLQRSIPQSSNIEHVLGEQRYRQMCNTLESMMRSSGFAAING